jgi:hypothetical protein
MIISLAHDTAIENQVEIVGTQICMEYLSFGK